MTNELQDNESITTKTNKLIGSPITLKMVKTTKHLAFYRYTSLGKKYNGLVFLRGIMF